MLKRVLVGIGIVALCGFNIPLCDFPPERVPADAGTLDGGRDAAAEPDGDLPGATALATLR